MRRIQIIQPVVGFATGVLVFLLVAFVSGYLAALPAPRGYFEWFGKSNLEIILAALFFTTYTVPVAILVGAVTLVVLAVLKSRSFAVPTTMLVGMLATFFLLASPPAVPRWWDLPVTLAPWLGFAIACAIHARSARREA